MSVSVPVGAQGTLEWTVAAEHCTTRGQFDVFSTPTMVRLLEEAAIEALAPHLSKDQHSVGSQVTVSHVAPTLRGQTVRAVATVTSTDRRRVTFEVVIEDDLEVVGRATHERFVVDIPRFEQNLADKTDRLS